MYGLHDLALGQGDRALSGRALLPVAGLGGAGSASVGWRGIDTSVAGLGRLQDLRRQLLGPPELRATG
jgi:hypothetical protein